MLIEMRRKRNSRNGDCCIAVERQSVQPVALWRFAGYPVPETIPRPHVRHCQSFDFKTLDPLAKVTAFDCSYSR